MCRSGQKGGLRRGSGQQKGSLPQYIPALDIYVSASPGNVVRML